MIFLRKKIVAACVLKDYFALTQNSPLFQKLYTYFGIVLDVQLLDDSAKSWPLRLVMIRLPRMAQQRELIYLSPSPGD
jgi:hypothetical protein